MLSLPLCRPAELLVPVALCQEHLGRKMGFSIITCCVPAEATLLDLKIALQAQLGPETAVHSLLYRGCKPALGGCLQDWAADSSQAPRFQASYNLLRMTVHVKVANGQELQLCVRC